VVIGLLAKVVTFAIVRSTGRGYECQFRPIGRFAPGA
jgi:hypothetical protein